VEKASLSRWRAVGPSSDRLARGSATPTPWSRSSLIAEDTTLTAVAVPRRTAVESHGGRSSGSGKQGSVVPEISGSGHAGDATGKVSNEPERGTALEVRHNA